MAITDLQFSESFWPADTVVRMTNVPWDSAYKDIVQFDDVEARDAWFDNQINASIKTTKMSYIAPGTTIVLPCPVTTAERYNYLWVSNPSYLISDDIDNFYSEPRRYFYFITDTAWLSPAACQVTLQLDVWTTWAPYITFKRAFVAQGHAAIANRNLWSGSRLSEITPQKMRRYLSTPEPVDAGGDYVPIYTSWTDLTKTPSGQEQGVFVGVMSSVDLSLDWGTATNPQIATASGSVQQGMLAGVQVVYFKVMDFLALLSDLRNAPWVSRNIMQIWLAPSVVSNMVSRGTIHGHQYYTPNPDSPNDSTIITVNIMETLADHYSADKMVAPKLMTAPYTFVELNCFEGSPLILKPQKIQSLAAMPIVARGLVMAPWNRLVIYPLYYGAEAPGEVTYDFYDIRGNRISKSLHYGDNLDSALWIDNFPTFSFTSDGYLSWLANGAHSRAWSYQNNDWNYHKTTLQRQTGYDQAVESMELANRQFSEKAQFEDANRLLSLASNLAGGFNAADPLGSIGRAVQTGANAFMGQAQANLERNQYRESQALSRSQLDTNNALAGYAARGDYQQSIAALAATQRDAEITPPSVIGSAGGNGWNYAMGLLGFRTTIKVPMANQEQVLLDFFKRFGYTINEIIDMPEDLRLMEHFTYWKVQESTLVGTVTETAKNAIRGIFERGVTVWNDPAYIAYLPWSIENGINSDNTFRY